MEGEHLVLIEGARASKLSLAFTSESRGIDSNGSAVLCPVRAHGSAHLPALPVQPASPLASVGRLRFGPGVTLGDLGDGMRKREEGRRKRKGGKGGRCWRRVSGRWSARNPPGHKALIGGRVLDRSEKGTGWKLKIGLVRSVSRDQVFITPRVVGDCLGLHRRRPAYGFQTYPRNDSGSVGFADEGMGTVGHDPQERL